MEIKLKKSTYLSLALFLVAVLIYSMPYLIDTDQFRVVLGRLNFYVFYPVILITTVLAVWNILQLNKTKSRRTLGKWIWINALILLFVLLFIVKALTVMLGSV